jgi:predicted nucleic acid-binding protein
VVLVDSSVWIDFFQGRQTPQTRLIAALLQADEELALADIILLEVLQGFRSDKQVQTAMEAFAEMPCFTVGGKTLAILAAGNYRAMRLKGLTIRSTIDCLIATFCIENDFPLLHNDRDYDPFEQHLGLRVIRPSNS